ncbi:polysaccharide biosynthesis protein CpsF [Streptococcus infantarius subsp. infantarius]|nr:polysaccharide biosynthesis protein CpsF [Streptococcus infantarius subsp. infantarius]
MKKVCFVSSSGGHWEELLCLEKVSKKFNSFYVTEKGGQSLEFKNKKLYNVSQTNRREPFFIAKFLLICFLAFKILFKEKPDVIISTGALISVPFCVIGKILGSKIIFIESFARVNNKSLSGKIIYPISDLFIVQWESMLKKYPKAKYYGGIF